MTHTILIGEVVVDVPLEANKGGNTIRLGGIIHAARALGAIGADYSIYYICPDYLDEAIVKVSTSKYGAKEAVKLGSVSGSPNVILIADPTEAGTQGYNLLLRKDFKCRFISKALRKLALETPADVIILSGAFDLGEILKLITTPSIKVHVDIANSISSITTVTNLGYKFQTIFLSTSSDIFKNEYSGSIDKLKNDLLTHYCENFLFKENRGGSRFFMSTYPDTPLNISTQIRKVIHSVGLGDCFDVVYAHLSNLFDQEAALNYASWIAAEYSVTTDYDQFKNGCKRVLGMKPDLVKSIRGITIPWEKRVSYNIYIAAPDFDYFDTTPIDYLYDALEYHNFKPRRPVKENGQMRSETTRQEKKMLCEKDLLILEECKLLIAVMINNDPGTLIEIGYAVAQKKPVIVYDLFNTAKNLMLTQLPNLVVNSLDEVIKGVFEFSSEDFSGYK